MKRIPILLVFLVTTSCARKVEVRAPEIIRAERYLYIKDDDGRLYIVTTSAKDPASVD